MITIAVLCVTAVLAASMLLHGVSMSTAMALLLCTMVASYMVLGDLGRIIRPLINKRRLAVLDESVRAGSKKMLFLAALLQAIRESHPILLLIPIYTYAAYAIGAFDASILRFGSLAVIEFVLSTAIDAIVAYAELKWEWRMYLV